MDKKYIYAILTAIILFNIIFTSDMISTNYPNGGDSVGHYDLLVNTIDVIDVFFETGHLRLWNPDYYFGFPMFFFYAPLPYFALALLSFTGINTLLLFNLSVVLLFGFIPVFVYSAMRVVELDETFALCAALFSSALSSVTVFGIEYYAFFATGLYSQLWGVVFFVFAFAFAYKYFVLNKGSMFYTVLFLFLTFTSHILAGFMAGIAVILIATVCLFFSNHKYAALKKVLTVLLLFFVTVSFIVIPYLMNKEFFGNISLDVQDREIGYGFIHTLDLLFKGQMLDYSFSFSRIPILTLLFFIGITVSFFWKQFRKDNKELCVLIFVLFIVSIILISGKTSFGFIQWIPLLSTIQTFRFIILFHLAAIFYIAIALYWIISLVRRFKKPLLIILVIMIISAPVFYERMHTFEEYGYAHDLTEDESYWNMINVIKENPLDMRMYVTNSNQLVEKPQHLQAIPLLTGSPIFFSTGIGGHDSLNAYYASFPLRYELIDLFAVDFIVGENNGELTLYITEQPTRYFSVIKVPFATDTDAIYARDAVSTWLYSEASTKGYFMEIGDGTREIVFTDIKNDDQFVSITESGDDFAHQLQGVMLYEKHSPIATVDGEYVRIYDFLQDYSETHESSNCGKVITEEHNKGYYKAKVSSEDGCTVLFKMTYHPEWHVYVDGIEQELLMISPAFMGVDVNSGEHEIVFSYEVFWYRKWLLVLGLLSLITLWLAERRFEKKEK